MPRQTLLQGLIALLGCVASLNASAFDLFGPPATLTLNAVPPADSADFRRLTEEANRILRSGALSENLRSLQRAYPTIFARPEHEITLAQTADYLAGKGARFVPMPVDLVEALDADGKKNASAVRYVEGGRDSSASMRIIRPVLERYRSPNRVQQACAINTLAHELSHTLSLQPDRFVQLFKDTKLNRSDHSVPRASYFLGSLAQCTYLQEVAPAQLARGPEALMTCLQVFGETAFNTLRCKSFRNDQPVALRPDLPAPMQEN